MYRTLALAAVLLFSVTAHAEPAWSIDFPDGTIDVEDWLDDAGWEEQRGDADAWRIVDGVLRTRQDDDSTTIGTKRGFPLSPHQARTLRYRFRVLNHPSGGDLRDKGTEDAALRIFVLFDKGGGFFSPPYTLGYAFGSSNPVGRVITSDRFDHVKYIVVASARSATRQWIEIERDIVADYQKAFGTHRVPKIAAIGIKSDANNTDGTAAAEVDWIRLDPK